MYAIFSFNNNVGWWRKLIPKKFMRNGKQLNVENLINEPIYLTSMDDSSVKLTGVAEPNNIYLHLARDGH